MLGDRELDVQIARGAAARADLTLALQVDADAGRDARGKSIANLVQMAAGEKVVLDPPATLADGAKVRVRATDARPGPAAGSAPGAR